MRIGNHPLKDFSSIRKDKVFLYFEGRKISAFKGENIAEALYASGVDVFRHDEGGRPRGLFCAIGKCSSCLMKVNGIPNIRTCITPVEDGMIIERQNGSPEIPDIKSLNNHKDIFSKTQVVESDVVIIGGGPAGLSAAITSADYGCSVSVIDENPLVGGQLVKQTHKFFGSRRRLAGVRGMQIAQILLNEAKNRNIKIYSSTSAFGIHDFGDKKQVSAVADNKRLVEFNASSVIVATGAVEKMIPFENNDLPGVYGAGAVQTLLNTYGIIPGNNVLIVGGGNVGLILAYQLLQAGVNVSAVIEYMPHIGGYFVHAAKIRRMGIPILTRHTILGVTGDERVNKAIVGQMDVNGNVIKKLEFDVDTVALAVGFHPSIELMHQAGCSFTYSAELGGHVVIRNEKMETSVKGIFTAGDASGIEEATTAMLEGKIAGISATVHAGKANEKSEEDIVGLIKELDNFRGGPRSAAIRREISKITEKYNEDENINMGDDI